MGGERSGRSGVEVEIEAIAAKADLAVEDQCISYERLSASGHERSSRPRPLTANNELRACYVAPEAAGTGVGKALLMKIEETARSAGVKYLYADSSLTAEQFYRSQGYEVIEYGHDLLRGRWPMACAKVKKAL